MIDVNQITTTLRGMADRALQQYAMMNKGNPYVLSLAVAESNQRKQLRTAAQARNMAPQPKVADAAIAGIAEAPPAVDAMGNVTGMASGGLPEDQGIGRLPAPNMQRMADGGIAGYSDDEEQGMATGGMGGMFNFAQQSEPVVRMSGGGMAGYVPGFRDTGEVNSAFEDAFRTTLRYEGGYVENDAGKGPSKFGINKAANPDVDVKSLTKDQARELYKKRYWDAIGGDSLAAKNPALAKVAFDTAVNMGPAKAKQLVEQSQGDPNAILAMRQQHYDKLIENDPKKFAPYKSGWQSRLADLATSVVPSAQAGELPKPAAAPAPAQPEKTGLESTDAGYRTQASMGAATMGAAGLQSLKDVSTAGFKPGTTAGQAGRALGLAAVVPQAVIQGGFEASKKARDDLQYMSPEQRRALSANPMLSAMSGDAGFASAIMDAAANNPEGPSKMPYAEQMKNVGKTILQHPDIDRMREANKAKAEVAALKDDPLKREPVSPDEFGSAVGIPEPALPKAEEKTVVEAAKEATPAKERKGFNNDDLLTLGLSLLANKSPRFMTALGEAGLATVAGKKEREKTEREEEKLKGAEELQKAQAKYYGAYAGAIERGAKEKNEELEAEKLVRNYMSDWEKNNKIANIQDPTARLQEENRIRQQIYASLGIKPIMAGQAAPAGAGDFKIVGVR